MVGDLLEQAKIIQRIQWICTKKFVGDRDRFASAAGISRNVVRDVLRGKLISSDAFDHVVNQVCRIPTVSKIWILKGEGHPFKQGGILGEPPPEASPAICEPDPEPEVKAKAKTKDKNGKHHMVNGNTNAGLDLFAGLVNRVNEFEKLVAAATVPESTIRQQCERHFHDMRLLLKKHADESEAKFKALVKSAEEQTIVAMEQDRKLGRLEAALIAQRQDIDRICDDLRAAQEILTAPPAPSSAALPDLAPPPPDEESRLGDDDVVTIAEYMGLSGARPKEMGGIGGQMVTIDEFVRRYEHLEGNPPPKTKDGKPQRRVKNLRLMHRFIVSRTGTLKMSELHDFIRFALADGGS